MFNDIITGLLFILVVYLVWLVMGYRAVEKEANEVHDEPKKLPVVEPEPEFDSVVEWFWYALLHK